MEIKSIIWDVGGVLLRTANFEPRKQLAQRLGMTMPELEAMVFGKDDNFRLQLGDISHEQHWENIGKRMDTDFIETARIRAEFFSEDQLDRDLIGKIRLYKSRGFHTGILSNFGDQLRWNLEEDWGIINAFQTVVISAEVGLMKPDPAIYQLLLEMSGFSAEETLFVDDFIENIKAAHELGIYGVHFQDKQTAVTEINSLLGFGNPNN